MLSICYVGLGWGIVHGVLKTVLWMERTVIMESSHCIALLLRGVGLRCAKRSEKVYKSLLQRPQREPRKTDYICI